MNAWIKASHLTLDVPVYLQRERRASGWGSVFAGAAFDPPQRRLSRLLDDVSFEVGEGDRLAILGRNGAGKSTLLRVLNRVYQPTSGSLEVQGSCQALLNMSLGFNGEATVRENILLRGIAMGLKASFLRGQIDSILEFAGLGHKAAHRLRTLSSGQKMRLGFAISTSVQHDIILMDEWVGAGDSDFMAKARERMHSRVGGSKIVVLASHSVGLLRDICNKGVVLEGGRLVYAGDVTSALKYYHDMMGRLRAGLEHVGPEHALGSAETTQVYGAVDRIEELGPGRFRLRGWMVDTRGPHRRAWRWKCPASGTRRCSSTVCRVRTSRPISVWQAMRAGSKRWWRCRGPVRSTHWGRTCVCLGAKQMKRRTRPCGWVRR